MLKKIRDFLQAAGPSETATVALHLGTDVSAARGMLEFLEQRGQVRRIEIGCGGGCSSCSGCGTSKKGRVERDAIDVVFWSVGK